MPQGFRVSYVRAGR